jgi:hypothetical protein
VRLYAPTFVGGPFPGQMLRPAIPADYPVPWICRRQGGGPRHHYVASGNGSYGYAGLCADNDHDGLDEWSDGPLCPGA